MLSDIDFKDILEDNVEYHGFIGLLTRSFFMTDCESGFKDITEELLIKVDQTVAKWGYSKDTH